MSLIDIKNLQKEKGFTIVELLIVIVVIAILAAIVIVAYNGIQNSARTTKAQTNAAAAQRVAEAFNADEGHYPTAVADFTNDTASLPTGVTLLTGTTDLSASNGEDSVDYDYVGSAGAATGARIQYWDFTGSGGISTNVLYLGGATSSSTFVDLAS